VRGRKADADALRAFIRADGWGDRLRARAIGARGE
jgi:hypothetical protein